MSEEGNIAIFNGIEYIYKEANFYISWRTLRFEAINDMTPSKFYAEKYNLRGKSSLDVLNEIVPTINLRIMNAVDMIDILDEYCANSGIDICQSSSVINIDTVNPSLEEIQQIVHDIVKYMNSCTVHVKIEEPVLKYEIPDYTFPESVSNMDELRTVFNMDIEIAKAAAVIEKYYCDVVNTMNAVCIQCKKIMSK
jgi:hypothetical protein